MKKLVPKRFNTKKLYSNALRTVEHKEQNFRSVGQGPNWVNSGRYPIQHGVWCPLEIFRHSFIKETAQLRDINNKDKDQPCVHNQEEHSLKVVATTWTPSLFLLARKWRKRFILFKIVLKTTLRNKEQSSWVSPIPDIGKRLYWRNAPFKVYSKQSWCTTQS